MEIKELIENIKQAAIILVILVTNSFFQSAIAQTQDWVWAKKAGGSISISTNSVTTDSLGNCYAVGAFGGMPLSFGSTTLLDSGIYDAFIVKYGPTGNVKWAKSAGGNDWDNPSAVAADRFGNLFVTGWFHSQSITFNTITLNNSSYPNADIFIAKYDSLGNILWAKSAGGLSCDSAQSITVDALGNAYIAGSFSSPSLTFGNSLLNNTNSGFDFFFAKYDPNGNPIWGKSANGSADDFATSISVNSNGIGYITGFFRSDSITLNSFSSLNSGTVGTTDIFLMRFDSAGSVVWLKGGSGITGDYSQSVCCDKSGNSILTGYFYSSSLSFGSLILNNNGVSDIFIAKYDSSGMELWAKVQGGTDFDYANAIAVDTSGNSYITGAYTSSSIVFGSTTFNAVGNTADIFLVKYDQAGNIAWAKNAAGNSDDVGNTISCNGTQDIYTGGFFYSPGINFGSNILLNSFTGPSDMYVAKISSISGLEPIPSNQFFSLFPNPTDQLLNITSMMLSSGPLRITIYDLEGRIIINTNLTGQILDVSMLKAGLYFITVSTTQAISNYKITVY